MVTNINLPIVLSFESEDHVKDFIEAAQEIIPKIKYEHISGEQYNCIVYTRKDKAFRNIMAAAEAPTTITEIPVRTITVTAGPTTSVTMPVFNAPVGDGPFVADMVVSWPVSERATDGSTPKIKADEAPGYFAMPTDPSSKNAK